MTLAKTLLLALSLLAVPAAIAQEAPAPTPVAAAPTPVATPAAAVAATKPAAPPEMLPTEGVGMPEPGLMHLPAQVTPTGRQALWMHDVMLMPIITLVSLFVLALMLWVIVRYRRSANPIPSKTSHNTLIEVLWTLIPVLILVAIAVPSISLLAAQYKPPGKDALTIKAVGNQWYWTYEYPDNGGFEIVSNMLKDTASKPGERIRTAADGPRLLAVDNRLVLPVGRQIKLIVTSNDVIHSWAMPSFWAKMDAVPGRLNEISFTIEKPGVYFGQCSELCGARHAFMPIVVEAVSPAAYAQWVASKGGTMTAAAPAAAAATATDAGDDTTTPIASTDNIVAATARPVTTSQSGSANTGANEGSK